MLHLTSGRRGFPRDIGEPPRDELNAFPLRRCTLSEDRLANPVERQRLVRPGDIELLRARFAEEACQREAVTEVFALQP